MKVETPEGFVEVYRTHTLRPIVILYRAEGEGCVCLRYNGENRYFKSLGAVISYARVHGLISDSDSLDEAKDAIRALDQREDRRIDRLHDAFMRGRAIGAQIMGQDPSDALEVFGERYDPRKHRI